MRKSLSRLFQKLFIVACGIAAFILILVSILLLVSQFSEASSKNEILSLTYFLVILTFSGLTFNWCRVPPSFASEETLQKIYLTGVHLFFSSLFALMASFFTWLQIAPETNSPLVSKACLILHWIFISLAVLFFLIGMLQLLAALARDAWKKTQ